MNDSRVNPERLQHVAIIMDGNNRWARREGKPSMSGHRVGVERIRDVLQACRQSDVAVLTVFAFSSENWRRPPREVSTLMGLFQTYLKREARRLSEEGVRLKVIGNRNRFSEALQATIAEAEQIASQGDGTLVIAADYGGQWDMAQAARAAAASVLAGELTPEQIDAQWLDTHISTAGLPPVDLLVRTGGELRISNFLLWQAAYAELYFTPLLWPEFDAAAMQAAIAEFHSRQRRFGYTGDQIQTMQQGGARA